VSTAYYWSLPPLAQAASDARRTLRDRCHHLPSPVLDDVLLLTSELVTNAVQHGAGEIHCCLWTGPKVLRVEVSEAGSAFPAPVEAGPDALSGRGLHIVSTIASRWGAAPDPSNHGKTVWFEIETGQE
jgi:anti-sigma regulatory factor (Ser/Thr protein kinase)